MPTYAITAPNGKSLEVTGDHVPTEPELQQIFKAAGVETAATPAAAPPTAHIGAAVPGTAIASDNPNIVAGAIGPKTRQMLDTPLAHTGVEPIDKLTTPANIGISALTGAALSRASLAPAANVLAQARAALGSMAANVGTQIKYEVVKSTLQALHVPAGIAIPLAMTVSGFKSGGKGAPAEATPAPAEAPPVEASPAPVQAPPSPSAATPPAPAAPSGTPPAVGPPAPQSAPAALSSDQTLTKLVKGGLSPSEANQALGMMKQGVPPDQIEARILSARQPSASSVTPPAATPQPPAAASTMSPARIGNELAMAARRAKVTLTPKDYEALAPLVQQGATADEAIKQLPAVKLAQMPGVLTPEQVAAEIAARKGNRSPTR